MDIVHQLRNLSRREFGEATRHEAIAACQLALAELQTPFERVWSASVEQPAVTAAVKVCLNIGLFEKWSSSGGGSRDYRELAAIAGVACRNGALRRFLRLLASHHVIREVGSETYAQTDFSLALCRPSVRAGIDYHYQISGPLYLKVPQYLHEHAYESPSDPRNGIFQYAFGDSRGKSVFEWYAHAAQDEALCTFNYWLGAYAADQVPWTHVYPTAGLVDGYDEDGRGPLLVDVGGNVGRDLDIFRAAHPDHGRFLVLQDLATVLAQAICASDVQRVEHDFFSPQPSNTTGARAYYLHSIIHDWSDEHARRILTHIRDAMTPGYSKLLVNDIVLASGHQSSRTTSIDIQMMAKLAAGERTFEEFMDLIEPIEGLTLVGKWEHPSSITTILELERESS